MPSHNIKQKPLIHSFILPIMNYFISQFIHSFIILLICIAPFMKSSVQGLIHRSVQLHSFIHWSKPPFFSTETIIHVFIHSLIHYSISTVVFIHPLDTTSMNSSIHQFIHQLHSCFVWTELIKALPHKAEANTGTCCHGNRSPDSLPCVCVCVK